VTGGRIISSLVRVIRGLSALFWGLPLSLLACGRTAMGDMSPELGLFPALAANGLILYGVMQLQKFHPQEQVWIKAVERAKLFALLNVALSPFPWWWNRWPDEPFFGESMLLLLFSGMSLLLCLNHALRRLAAMLPDETLRSETGVFTALNSTLIFALVALVAAWMLASLLPAPPIWLNLLLVTVNERRGWLVVVLALLPLALTMTLLWRAKEALFNGLGERQ
jgi:hypothetical protein